MLKKLLVVAASAAVLSLVAFSAAFVVGGSEFRSAVASGDLDLTIGQDDGPRGSREFEFDTSRELTVEMPVELRFERSDTVSFKVEGPAKAIENLTYSSGTLALAGHHGLGHGLNVTITAPTLAGLVLDAPGDVDLVQLDQDAIEIHSSGAADVHATGKVRKVVLVGNGAADFDFAEVVAQDANVEINGAGDVAIAASGRVEIEINGAGSVTLHTKPRSLSSEINGVGSVDHAY